MVRTFELANGGARETEPAAGLAESSARLPRGVYTTLRTYGGDRVVRFGEHIRRLEESAAAQGLAAHLDEAALRSSLAAALRATAHPESRIRLTWTPPRISAAIEPFEPLPAAWYENGVSCATVRLRRDRPQAKDTRFLGAAEAAYAALPPGRHEGLLVGEDGALLEGLSSNFFAVREGILHTEDERVLHGLTRALVLEVARSLLPRATAALRLDQLAEASESFITSASRGILPVVRVDEVWIGRGRPGPLTGELRARFQAQVEREAQPLAAVSG
jgi:branched-chain amino acid aminotransferase